MSDLDSLSNFAPVPGKTYEVLTPGEKFGEYQILRCLSYDLLGSLYQVRKTKEKDLCCIFLLPPMVKNDAHFRARFAEKANELLGMEHENVLAFTQHAVIKERYCLYCEPFQGENLADYLMSQSNQGSPITPGESSEELLSDQAFGLPQEEVRSIVKQILQALQFAHERQIYHLNLNPTNILRDSAGHIKVVGFGLINMAGKELFENLVSAGIPPIALGSRRIRINTVDILSPETRLGKTADHRADIYALGITAYWLLTGTKPSSKYQPPSELVDDLLPGWDTLISHCLEREPSNRYQSTAHVLQDLENLDHLEERSEPLDVGTRETGSVFRHIDFIPVPEKLQHKGTSYARAFRLSTIGIIGLILMFITTSFFDNTLTEDVDYERAVAIRTPAGTEPRLTFNIRPKNAQLRFVREDLIFLTQDGTLDLNVIPGDYRVEITAPQHEKHTQLIQVIADPQTLNIRLQQAWGMLTLNTLPGASAIAEDAEGNRVDLGQADASGLITVSEKLIQGSYKIDVSKPNYATMARSITLSADPVEETFNLGGLPGTLRIRSNPRGANVVVDGKELGKTNLTVENLPVNEKFMVTVKLDGYRQRTKAVTLKPGTRTPLDFGNLEQQRGNVEPVLTVDNQTISPEIAKSLEIQLNDQKWPGDTHIIEDLVAGTYQVRIDHPDYQPLNQEIDVPDNTTLKLILNLIPKPALLIIRPKPTDIQPTLKVNNHPRPLGDGNRFAIKPGVRYQLSLEAKDHYPVSKTIQLKPNETFTWDAELKPIPGPELNRDYTVPYTMVELAWIEPGRFEMGSPKDQPSRLPTDGPQTTVTLTQGYWIGKFEIIQEQYKQITGKNPAYFNDSLRKPVENVSWDQAVEFCSIIQAREAAAGRVPPGYAYRLPTEAEWEYAGRAGTTTPFYWGNTADKSQGNFKGAYPRDFTSTVITSAEHYGTVEAGSFQPNAFGLYDIHGNVSEWCMDYYNARLPGGSKIDWVQTQESSRRVFRGGGWENFAIAARIGARGQGARESSRGQSLGFRIVLGPVLTR